MNLSVNAITARERLLPEGAKNFVPVALNFRPKNPSPSSSSPPSYPHRRRKWRLVAAVQCQALLRASHLCLSFLFAALSSAFTFALLMGGGNQVAGASGNGRELNLRPLVFFPSSAVIGD
ncbi:uncharacterized protein LOC129305342 [Prosopis cineraria]|uniref:uncharacterized protein LOC129305342 n=1 Tax=Prosopis cineraria TaxID=364024 RepID=UPI00240FAF21|nr:uncharacterized protein LOC129305342 [Prosopis cineraria]